VSRIHLLKMMTDDEREIHELRYHVNIVARRGITSLSADWAGYVRDVEGRVQRGFGHLSLLGLRVDRGQDRHVWSLPLLLPRDPFFLRHSGEVGIEARSDGFEFRALVPRRSEGRSEGRRERVYGEDRTEVARGRREGVLMMGGRRRWMWISSAHDVDNESVRQRGVRAIVGEIEGAAKRRRLVPSKKCQA